MADPGTDYVERARKLAPQVRAAAERAERDRHVPREIAEAMAQAELYRVAAPASLGGLETHALTQIGVIEAVSEADGAIGWALMIGIENLGFLGAALPVETARELYADPGLIVAGALNPLGKARREDGGYRISGQWPFASGVHNAQFFWGQNILVGDAGEPIRDSANAPQLLESLFTRDEFEILDTWNVHGLRGSGSHDVRAQDVFVPDARITRALTTRPRETGTLFRLPPFSRLAYNKVGVATGVARAAIREFVALACEKKPRINFKLLRERPQAQLALADAEALLRSARAFVFDAVGDLWNTVEAGDPPTTEQRALVQLACSKAATESVKAVGPLVECAGTSANEASNALGRCWRDVQVVRQHIMVSPQWIPAAGRALLGLPSETVFF